jgi:hypothetical protein
MAPSSSTLDEDPAEERDLAGTALERRWPTSCAEALRAVEAPDD